jgi:hypothetical protein
MHPHFPIIKLGCNYKNGWFFRARTWDKWLAEALLERAGRKSSDKPDGDGEGDAPDFPSW